MNGNREQSEHISKTDYTRTLHSDQDVVLWKHSQDMIYYILWTVKMGRTKSSTAIKKSKQNTTWELTHIRFRKNTKRNTSETLFNHAHHFSNTYIGMVTLRIVQFSTSSVLTQRYPFAIKKTKELADNIHFVDL